MPQPCATRGIIVCSPLPPAIFGTTAVLLAIVQLSGLFPGMWPVQLSGIAVAFALIAVIAGLHPYLSVWD